MGSFVAAVTLVALALLALLLEKTYFYVPYRELKREAAAGDLEARTLFNAAAYGAELKLLLWMIMGLCLAGGFVLFARVAPVLLGLAVILLVILLAFMWLPRTQLSVAAVRLGLWSTPVLVALLRVCHPLLQYVPERLGRYRRAPHTGLYDRMDLDALLERQHEQSDSRIDERELVRLRHALRFGDYAVHDVMTPRANVLAAGIDDDLSPVLIDELHHSGHSHFPVYEGKKSQLVGTLALDVVADIKHQGIVRHFYSSRLAYVHENDSLEQALLALYETGQHLLVAVDTAGDYVGIVTLGDVLRYLLGSLDHGTGQHDDRQAVAARHRAKPISDADVATSDHATEVVQ
ncbi:MAG TPA: CBS domain-containing protein [Candidatus Saccharimonadales bacterium]|nr:CBS domain-containing protein [Candidatus Saccharimonadales bacterium]